MENQLSGKSCSSITKIELVEENYVILAYRLKQNYVTLYQLLDIAKT